MSEKERELIKNISALPEELKDKFAALAEGAAMAVEMLGKEGKDAAGA